MADNNQTQTNQQTQQQGGTQQTQAQTQQTGSAPAIDYEKLAAAVSDRAAAAEDAALNEKNTFRRHDRRCFLLERMMGVEPTLSAWEAGVLPMNYIRRVWSL